MAFRNVVDNTSTTVSASTPGLTVDLRSHATLRTTSQGVPVRFMVAAYSAGALDSGAIKLLDSTGAAVLTALVNAPAAGEYWYWADGYLPATLAKYDVHFGGNILSTLTPYAASVIEIDWTTDPLLATASMTLGAVTVTSVAMLDLFAVASMTLGAVTVTSAVVAITPASVPAIYAGQASGGDTAGTSNRTCAVTPAIGELLVVAVNVSTNTNAAPTCSDDQGGTYYLAGTAAWNTSADMLSVFVRQQPVSAASATTITAATGANDAGVVGVIRVSSMTRFGASAVRQIAFQANQAAATTPTPSFAAAALTTSVTICGVASGDTTTTPNASWTERIEASQITPTTALEVATRDSGFTGTAITFGATCATVFASFALELDCRGWAFAGSYPTSAAEMNTATGGGTWAAGWLMNEASGNAAPTFGAGNLTATGTTYSNTGMVYGETAIGLDTATDKLSGGDIYDIGSNDLVFCLVVKITTRGNKSIASKRILAEGNSGWQLDDQTTSIRLAMELAGPPTSTATINYSGSNEWAVIMGVREIGVGMRLALYAPSVGYMTTAASSAPDAAQTTTEPLAFGDTPGTGLGFLGQIDAFYIGNASGAGASMANNLLTRLRAFVESLG